jgi:predicted subunit of tRNA(5-methylaminomethyl-2-thiouridylate) methyltransferase
MIIRWISGFQRKDKVNVINLEKEMHIKSIEDRLCIKRLMWLGRLTRMDGRRLVSRVWGAECHDKRAPGGGGEKGRIIRK